MNTAYREKLYSNYATRQTKTVLHENIGLFIDYNNNGFPHNNLKDLTSAIQDSILPKFDSLLLDRINGMGITVHDVYATKIEVLRLDVNEYGWKASIRFTGQDHFGLDVSEPESQYPALNGYWLLLFTFLPSFTFSRYAKNRHHSGKF